MLESVPWCSKGKASEIEDGMAMMIKLKFSLIGFWAITVFVFLFRIEAAAQIRLNEIEVDTPSGISEPCEFIEVIGPPGSVVPPNTFFLSIDGETGNYGFIDYIANLGGLKFGSNGTITIVTASVPCRGRQYPAETTMVKSTSFAMGFGAETFLLVSTPHPKLLFEGQDLDENDDGKLDAKYALTPIDGVAWVVDPAFEKVYGGAPIIFSGNKELPDAATRFPGDLTPFSPNSWYYGEVAPPDNSTKYAEPKSPNFPSDGALTPGAPNLGASPSPSQRSQIQRRGSRPGH